VNRAIGSALVVAMLATTAYAREARTLTDMVKNPDRYDLVPPPPPPTAPTLDEITKSGMHWRLETERGPVHVWIPAGYEPATAATVVFVHGYKTDIDSAWSEYRLPEQFALAGINAMFIAGAAPDGKRAAIVWPSLTQLLATVAGRIDIAMPKNRLVAVGHSGAYRTLALWLDNEKLDSVVLLDALYGEYRFGPWVRDKESRRLINIAYETGRFSDYMHRSLPATVRVDGLPIEGFPEARIVDTKTPVGHWALVTEGVALPLSLRALALPRIALPVELPLGLPLRCTPKLETDAEKRAAETAAIAAKIVLPPL
jgi:hypothetical protein